MDLLIVRHAAAMQSGRGGEFKGDPDPPLNALGRQQAAAVAERLGRADLTHLYSSPSLRCLETAQAICAAAQVRGTAVPWLSEWGWAWQTPGPAPEVMASRFADIAAAEALSEAEWGMARAEWDNPPEIARPALRARGETVAARLLAAHPRASLDRVCLCTHMGFSGAALLPALLEARRELASFDLDNAALTEVECHERGNFIVRANCGRHLAGLTVVLCSDPACAQASPQLEDRACRRCGGPVLLKCPTCRTFIPAPAGPTCPDCGRPYHG